MSRDRLTTYAWSVLSYNLLVILWGAYVRASGSGAGCGSHWPLCNGEVLPRAPSVETLIELTHRTMSGVALLMVVGLAVWCFRLHPKGHLARLAAAWSLILMLVEAAIGAGLVLFEMVADNASMARALWMSAHLGNTLLLLAAMTLTAHWSAPAYRPPEGDPPVLRWAGQGRLRRLIVLAVAGTVVLGISGAVAALGDTIFPATSLGEELRQDFSPATSVLKQLRLMHPLIAVVVSLALLQLIHAVRRRQLAAGAGQDGAKRWANRLHLLVFVQLVVGTANIVLLAPIWIQLVHLLLADLLWLCLVLTCVLSLEVRETGTAAD